MHAKKVGGDNRYPPGSVPTAYLSNRTVFGPQHSGVETVRSSDVSANTRNMAHAQPEPGDWSDKMFY